MYIQEMLRHYVQVMRYHFKLIVLGVLFGSTITFILSLLQPPVYQASALVKVNSTSITAATGNDVFSAQAQAVSYAILVTSPEVLQAAAKKLPGMTREQLKNVVSDSPVNNTELIEIRSQAENPQRAADIANIVASTFVQFQETEERTHLQHVVDKLAQNLVQAKIAIDTAQQHLTTLQHAHAMEDSIAQQQSLLATYQSTYNALLSSNEQLQTQKQATADILSVTQQALPPDKPTSPQLALNTLLAACLSLLLMMVLALLDDWLDSTIQTVDDVVQLVALEPLGSIPLGTTTTQLFELEAAYSDAVKEAYRMLGTAFRILRRGERTILVTSPRSGTGTTAAATYLALSLAQSGMRVLLVDANLHRPSLHTIFLRSDTHGLADSLHDMYALQEPSTPLPHLWLNQWKTHIPNLWQLPVGPLGPYPTSLLHEPALAMLRDRLLGRLPHTSEQSQRPLVDMIIFDTAALEDGTDACRLAAIADATVLIIEAGKEHKETLQRLNTTFERLGAPLLGVIINKQQKRHRSYFYAPRQVSTEKKGVPLPSPDLIAFPLPPQVNHGTHIAEHTSSRKHGKNAAKMEVIHGKEGESVESMGTIPPRLTLKSIQSKKEHLPLQSSTLSQYTSIAHASACELAATPTPLSLAYQDIATIMLTRAAAEPVDAPFGELQFGPLLRLSGAMSRSRNNEPYPEVH